MIAAGAKRMYTIEGFCRFSMSEYESYPRTCLDFNYAPKTNAVVEALTSTRFSFQTLNSLTIDLIFILKTVFVRQSLTQTV